MALISISSAQGNGKTTLLNDLKEAGYNVIEKKSSRTILKEMGMDLNEINRNKVVVKEFQERVLELHYNTDLEYVDKDEIFFRERSYADVFTYALFQLSQYNEYDSWFNEYYEKCKEYQHKMYQGVINLKRNPTGGKVEDDGVRSVNQYFTHGVGVLLEHYICNFNNKCNGIRDIYYIDRKKRVEDVGIYYNLINKINLGN